MIETIREQLARLVEDLEALDDALGAIRRPSRT